MTLKQKIKHMLHPSGHKKSPPSSSPSSTTPSPSPASPTPYKPDPNKPPNARDPGFRKSFNLAEESREGSQEESNITPPVAESHDIGLVEQHSTAQNIPANEKAKMYTVDKYGEDYLAVSPRTNVTVPESLHSNKGRSVGSPLDQETKAILGSVQESKTSDQVAAAAKKLDELPSSQQSPDFGREQFAQGDRTATGNIEPVPTRDATFPNTSPDRQHPTSFALESTPSVYQAEGTQGTTAFHSAPAKPNNLLSPPTTVEDGSSSIYSDDSVNHPGLQRITSESFYNPSLPASPPLNPGVPLKATVHQQQYTSLVSDLVPDPEPPKSQLGSSGLDFGLPTLPNGDTGDFLTAVKSTSPDSSHAEGQTPGASAGMTKTHLANSNTSSDGGNRGDLSIDQQAEAFADIVSSHLIASPKVDTQSQRKQDVSEDIPDTVQSDQKPISTTTNTVSHAGAAQQLGNTTLEGGDKSLAPAQEKRPEIQHTDSILEVTKGIPGAF